MVKINILLTDIEYREAFVERLRNSDISVDAEIIREITQEYIYDESLLVTDRVLGPEERTLVNEKAVVYLSDGSISDTFYESSCISKYNAMNDNIAQLSRIYADVFESHESMVTEECRVIAVCCTEEGEGNVADLSRFISHQMAYIRRCRVLLLSLRDLNTFAYKGRENEFERLVYYLQEGRRLDLGSFFYRDDYGVYYIRTCDCYNRITAMTAEDRSWLIRELSEYFQCIVIHVGSSLNDDNQRRVAKSDLVFCADENLSQLKVLLSDVPESRIHPIKWNLNPEESEMEVADLLRDCFENR